MFGYTIFDNLLPNIYPFNQSADVRYMYTILNEPIPNIYHFDPFNEKDLDTLPKSQNAKKISKPKTIWDTITNEPQRVKGTSQL
jgi:hypothetical protein